MTTSTNIKPSTIKWRRRHEAAKACVNAYKTSHLCTDCGRIPAAPGTALFAAKPGSPPMYYDITDLVRRGTSLSRLAEEMARRDLLCRECYNARMSNGRKKKSKDEDPTDALNAPFGLKVRNGKWYDADTGAELTDAEADEYVERGPRF
jgi:hypothetical protein